MARLFGIPAHDAREIWPQVREMLLPAISLSLGKHSEESVLRCILERDMQLWVAVAERPVAAAVTQINVWPTGMRTCNIMFAGGTEMKRWTYTAELIGEWAAEQGCRYLEVHGRKGWERVLKWDDSSIELVKDLRDG